ncbi:MAG: UbiD family decarboxylase [Pirellulaceae bacterium]|nr:UbiD family decarboxylase [Pirellulaceae bacterium]
MPYRCLSEFLEELDHADELSRIEEAIDAALELADRVARSAAEGGGSLLFTSIKGHDIPLAANLLAAEGRIRRALGGEPLDAVAARLECLLDNSAPEGWFDRLKTGSQPAAIGGVVPRKVRAAACQQIVRLGGDIDLGELPIPQCSPEESNRTIYSASVFTAEPDSHLPFCGRFDLQQLDRSRLAVCWAAYDEHARLLDEYRARNQKMPLAVVIGGDPAFQLAASAPLPADTDVCALAGLLRQKPIDVVACRGADLAVPAEAEIIIEGLVDPAEPPVTVGPMLAPLGHLTRPRQAPVMQVTAVTHRANPIFAAYMPGNPPHEICTITRAMQRAFLPLLRLPMPELVDFDLPEFAAARHWAAVSIDKTYPGQGRRAAHAAWGLRPMRFAKTMIVVDADVDPRDRDQVLAAIAKNFRPELDVITERFPADPYDPIPPTGELAERIAIDATRK